ncbi:ADP-ribose pyrophosphatase [Striga asiatica]|uniref:ADP-ribose pyrophosphatase n=1 Tax=Striga asiatica TaxID=4170 RepID=A0A5A7PHB7_STRAF|nr:ADP-ribose pyrophosphatase [Striga asiatica]
MNIEEQLIILNKECQRNVPEEKDCSISDSGASESSRSSITNWDTTNQPPSSYKKEREVDASRIRRNNHFLDIRAPDTVQVLKQPIGSRNCGPIQVVHVDTAIQADAAQTSTAGYQFFYCRLTKRVAANEPKRCMTDQDRSSSEESSETKFTYLQKDASRDVRRGQPIKASDNTPHPFNSSDTISVLLR